ncbi:MAG: hypothetical protein JRJ26_16740, partial [Deltaproteobacteria bacterium]|nr:hypothetical protein [Deltaproteobacteria bacterium]
AYYIYRNDAQPDIQGMQNVTTHTIGFTISNQLLEDTAANGGGQYYTADNAQELSEAFTSAIQKILEVSMSYTAPVVPISSMEKTSSGDNIYLALFKPSRSAFWKGNIKKFWIATADDATHSIERGDILDMNGDRATNDSGYILDTAVSSWGSAADGGETESGGVGKVLLDRASDRNIYTFLDKDSKPINHPSNAFTKTNPWLTRQKLGAADDDDRDKVIDFIHGLDAYDEDQDLDTTEKRPWILGAFLHSRPEVVHYQDRTVIYAGANDGMLHAFDDGNGEELWAYIPPTLLSKLQGLSGKDLLYFVDGSPRVYRNDVNQDGVIDGSQGDQAILLCGLRRGGRYYFALDVTNPLNPEIPEGWADWGVWESGTWHATGMIGPDMTTESTVEASATYPYAEMGQSWSTPVLGRIGTQAGVKDVAFIGGGYDPNQDQTTPGPDSMGRAVYVVDIFTGSPICTYTDAAMEWSIPGEIAAIDTTGNGLVDRLYVGDTGGRLWRMDIRSLDPADWTAKILFDANESAMPGEPLRKIFYPPDVTLEVGYEMVFFGTGDRAHPRRKTVINRIYAVKDRNPGEPLGEGDLEDVTMDFLQDPTFTGDKNNLRNRILNGNGWYISLLDNLGEKVLSPAVVFGGVTYLTTYVPTDIDDPCTTQEGTAMLYALNYRTGEAVFDYDVSGGILGRSDRSMVIGASIPSGMVVALIQGEASAYVGIRGGIFNPAIGSIGGLTRAYWRVLF